MDGNGTPAQDFDVLVGKKVEAVYFDRDTELGFLMEDGSFYLYSAVGDCCSESWVEHVNGVHNLEGQTILETSISNSVSVECTRHEEYEYAEFVTFKTTKGYFDFEFRNANNGYYGGYFEMETFNGVPDFLKVYRLKGNV